MGFGFLLYLVLWIVLPQAATTEQIREMKTGSNYF
jgi:phage shock protein PspC (stress-responsive transcriptional regulator)